MKTKISLLVVIFLASCLRFYQLGNVPAGLTNDEANIGYDAYSILKTGRDQWGKVLPLVSFKGFGDHRLPFYTYLTVPSVFFFGLNQLAVRFPSALLGVATVYLTFLLTRHFLNDKVGLLAAFLLAISPWHIAMSRIGIESNAAVFLVVLGVYFFYLGLAKKRFLWLSFLIFTLSFYTYYSVRLFVPLLLLGLFYHQRKKLLKNKGTILKVFLVCFLLALPIFSSLFKTSGQARISHLTFTQDLGVILKINEKRGECLKSFSPLVCRLTHNKATAFLPKFVTNYLNHFSTRLLFIERPTISQSIMPPRGLLYPFEFPFLLIGLYYLAKGESKARWLFFSWLLLAPLADSLTGPEHVSRMLVFLPSFQIAAALGFYQTYLWFKKIGQQLITKLAIFTVALVITASLYLFFFDYFVYFPAPFSRYSHYGYQELFIYLNDVKDDYDQVYLSSRHHDTKHYVFYLFFTQYDPKQYQKKENVTYFEQEGGWIKVAQVDNLFFVDTVPAIDDLPTRSLVVADPIEFKRIKTKRILSELKIISDLKGDVLFKVIEIINQEEGARR